MKPIRQPSLALLFLVFSTLAIVSTALPTFFHFNFGKPQTPSSTSTLPSTSPSSLPQPTETSAATQIQANGEVVSPHDKQRHREMVKRNVLNWAQIAEMCVDDPDLELCWKLWGFGPGSEKWNTAKVVKELPARY